MTSRIGTRSSVTHNHSPSSTSLLTSTISTTSKHSSHYKHSRLQESELQAAITQLRQDILKWDGSTRLARKSMLERFLYLHHAEEGIGIGSGSRAGGKENTAPAIVKDKEKEEVKEPTAATTAALSSTTTDSLRALLQTHPTSLSTTSLESLYSSSASLLLMRITSWLRLTYTLTTQHNLLNLKAIRTFLEDSQSGVRFVHEFVEAGGILTLLSIVESQQQNGSKKQLSSTTTTSAQHSIAVESKQEMEMKERSPPSSARSIASPVPTTPSLDSSSRHSAATTTSSASPSPVPSSSRREIPPLEKEYSLSILHRISCTGRPFREMICEQHGVGIVIACLARVANGREKTQSVAKELLCSLGSGNPRYASLVHEELLSVFRRSGVKENQCKRIVCQTLYYLLNSSNVNSNDNSTPSESNNLMSSSVSTSSLLDSSASSTSFTADARYVEATVSLYHINDYQLHYEAHLLLKLLILKHGLRDATLQALAGVLKMKSTSSSFSSVATGLDSIGGGDSSSSLFNRNRRDSDGSMQPPQQQQQKPSDPKLCAIKLLTDLSIHSSSFCLRLVQYGFIPLLLQSLCQLNNYELQHSSIMLLQILHRETKETAGLVKWMMNGNANEKDKEKDGNNSNTSTSNLYDEFLKNPESMYRFLTPSDVKRIMANIHQANSAAAGLSSPAGVSNQRKIAAAAAAAASARASRAVSKNVSPVSSPKNQSSIAEEDTTAASEVSSSSTSKVDESSEENETQKSTNEKTQVDSTSSASTDQSQTQAQMHSSSSQKTLNHSSNNTDSRTSLLSTQLSSSLTHHDEDDSNFFALGMSSIPRVSESDLMDSALRLERANERARRAVQAQVTAALKPEEKKSDVVTSLLKSITDRPSTSSTTTNSRSRSPTRTKEEADMKQAELARRSVRSSMSGLSSLMGGSRGSSGYNSLQGSARGSMVIEHGRRAGKSGGGNGLEGEEGDLQSAMVTSAIPSSLAAASNEPILRVPVLSLRFDSKLRLVDQGAPPLSQSVPIKLQTMVPSGVHEGGSGGSTTAAAGVMKKEKTGSKLGGAEDEEKKDKGIYTPFASITNSNTNTSSTPTSTTSSSHIFSQRVGLPPTQSQDHVSESYQAIHFRDLMLPVRRKLLKHGEENTAPSGKSQQLNSSSNNSDTDYLLPPLIPTVEVLDSHDTNSLLPAKPTKTSKMKQEELKKRRDEKRADQAAAVANVVQQHMASTSKYGASGGAHTGFTAATMVKQKSANQFGSKKALTLEQVLQAKMRQEDLLQQAAFAAASSASQTPSHRDPMKQVASELSQQTSTKTILQMAIQVDNTGRTIDPRRWGAAARRGSGGATKKTKTKKTAATGTAANESGTPATRSEVASEVPSEDEGNESNPSDRRGGLNVHVASAAETESQHSGDHHTSDASHLILPSSITSLSSSATHTRARSLNAMIEQIAAPHDVKPSSEPSEPPQFGGPQLRAKSYLTTAGDSATAAHKPNRRSPSIHAPPTR